MAPAAASPAAGKSPFHAGEQQVQALTGARDVSEQLGRAWHSDELRPAAAAFLAQQQFLYTASRNADGSLWASVLAGPAGFLSSPDPGTLVVSPLRQFRGDAAELADGDFLGTLGIVLETRQRERLNGLVAGKADGSLTLRVQQSFSGCPKYIQARRVELDVAAADRIGSQGTVSTGGSELGAEQRQMIEQADTLFLATCFFGELAGGDGVRGTDASHRGGPPGFVTMTAPGTLRFADYVGNYTFTTLGNLALEPRAALLFLDFATGSTLQLSGRCAVLWEERSLPGAERTLEFVTERWVHVAGALPLRPPSNVRWSPYNPLPTCQYSAAVGEERLQQLYHNYVAGDKAASHRRCLARRREAAGVTTYEFEGSPSLSGARVLPGQYAAFDFADASLGQAPLSRTWTVSSTAAEMAARGSFTISVKQVGLVSAWLDQHMQPGRTICLRGTDGAFSTAALPALPAAGVLLLAGGIGITPLRVMFHDCIEKGVPVTLLYSVRTAAEAAFLTDLKQAAQAAEPGQAAVWLALTGGEEGAPASAGACFRVGRGRIDAPKLAEACDNVCEREVFLCGPPGMMQAATTALAELGHPPARLHSEAFFF